MIPAAIYIYIYICTPCVSFIARASDTSVGPSEVPLRAGRVGGAVSWRCIYLQGSNGIHVYAITPVQPRGAERSAGEAAGDDGAVEDGVEAGSDDGADGADRDETVLEEGMS